MTDLPRIITAEVLARRQVFRRRERTRSRRRKVLWRRETAGIRRRHAAKIRAMRSRGEQITFTDWLCLDRPMSPCLYDVNLLDAMLAGEEW